MLTATNAFFVAAEFSLVTVDRAEIDRLADVGVRKARTVRRALRHLSFQLSGAQLGITISALLTGYIAQPAFDVVLRPLHLPSGVTHAIALTIATLLSMLLGELVPKNAALALPMPLALRTAGGLLIFSRAFTWMIFLLNGTANWLVRRLGIEPQEELASARSPEELGLVAAISAKAGALPTETALLLQRTVRFREKRAAEAMTPRVDVIGLTKEATVADLIALSRESGHSRFPVYEETLDQVTGVVSLIDALSVKPLMRPRTSAATVAREPVLVPETLDLDGVWEALRAGNADLAIVVDEYGGTDGVVTLEDLVEELVGEIADEHDVEEFPEAVDLMVLSDAREHVVDGVLREDELREQTGFRLPEGPYETLAGFLMAQLGHIPRDGEVVTYNGWEFTIVEMDRNRVEQVRVVRPATDADGETP